MENILNNLRLKETQLSINPIEKIKIYFVICNSCYWCASYFSIDDLESSSRTLECHGCKSHNTKLMPFSTES
jgi:uncharacterized protein (UPF0262 family)